MTDAHNANYIPFVIEIGDLIPVEPDLFSGFRDHHPFLVNVRCFCADDILILKMCFFSYFRRIKFGICPADYFLSRIGA